MLSPPALPSNSATTTVSVVSRYSSRSYAVITTADLKAQTRRELADLAKNYGINGWHGMKKDELITAIGKLQRGLRRKGATAKTGASKTGSSQAESKSMAPRREKS